MNARRRWRCPLVRLCVLFHFPCSCRYSARLTCVAHVSEETGVSCEGQLSVPVLRVWSLLVSHPQVETRVRQRCEEQGPVSCSLFPELGMSGDTEAETLFSVKAEMCEVHTVVRCWSTHNKCDRFGDLWIAVVRCCSDSNCDDSWAMQQDVRARKVAL